MSEKRVQRLMREMNLYAIYNRSLKDISLFN
ncbi:hypothetical protein [Clostridium algidicarnis]